MQHTISTQSYNEEKIHTKSISTWHHPHPSIFQLNVDLYYNFSTFQVPPSMLPTNLIVSEIPDPHMCTINPPNLMVYVIIVQQFSVWSHQGLLRSARYLHTVVI